MITSMSNLNNLSKIRGPATHYNIYEKSPSKEDRYLYNSRSIWGMPAPSNNIMSQTKRSGYSVYT